MEIYISILLQIHWLGDKLTHVNRRYLHMSFAFKPIYCVKNWPTTSITRSVSSRCGTWADSCTCQERVKRTERRENKTKAYGKLNPFNTRNTFEKWINDCISCFIISTISYKCRNIDLVKLVDYVPVFQYTNDVKFIWTVPDQLLNIWSYGKR